LSVLQRFREDAKKSLERALKSFDVKIPSLTLMEPPKEMGDLSSTVAFEIASRVKRPPRDIAEELAEKITPERLISKVEAVSGYLNFHLNYKEAAKQLIQEVREKEGNYGRGTNKGLIILEHTSANPDGPLHIGHGRNAIIGDTLARLLQFSGYDVETQFYVNDMGKQLAVVVWGLRRLNLNSKTKKDAAIAEVYVKANKLLEGDAAAEREVGQLIKRYEDGEEEIEREFREAADYCLMGIKETLKRLGVEHDRYVWESRFVRESSVSKVLEKLRNTRYARENDVFSLDLRSFGLKKELVLTRSDGTHLYATRDIAYHLWKAKKGRVVDILGADHKLLASQLKAVHMIMGIPAPEVIIYEFITLPGGSMSTRRGVFISVDELLEESVRRAYKEVEKRRGETTDEFKEKIAEAIGVAAVRFNIMRVAPEKPMVFRWEEALDFERQGAPFVLYAYARACRILEKGAAGEKFSISELSKYETGLLKAIARFPDVVKQAATSKKPSVLASYAVELADSFHRFYMFEPVLKAEERDFRLNLVLAAKTTLGNLLRIMGIKPLEEM
jgi:arginyl-tRNA synthetase